MKRKRQKKNGYFFRAKDSICRVQTTQCLEIEIRLKMGKNLFEL